jgi:hypothetical protein
MQIIWIFSSLLLILYTHKPLDVRAVFVFRLPKDALTYFAGISPIKPLRFLIITSIARFPGILGSIVDSPQYTAGEDAYCHLFKHHMIYYSFHKPVSC